MRLLLRFAAAALVGVGGSVIILQTIADPDYQLLDLQKNVALMAITAILTDRLLVSFMTHVFGPEEEARVRHKVEVIRRHSSPEWSKNLCDDLDALTKKFLSERILTVVKITPEDWSKNQRRISSTMPGLSIREIGN